MNCPVQHAINEVWTYDYDPNDVIVFDESLHLITATIKRLTSSIKIPTKVGRWCQ